MTQTRPAPAESAGPPIGLNIAVALSAAGALLGGLAPLFAAVTPSMPPAFTSWPLLLVLALIPTALSAALLRRKPGVAAAVLLGPAVLAPGRFVQDMQLVVDASYAARPELLHADTLEPLAPAAGTWVLLAGHVLTTIAGALAVIAGGKLFDRTGGAAFGAADSDRARARKQGLLALVLCASVVASVGALMGPFTSTDPYLLAKPAVDAPAAVGIGSLLLALALLTAAGVVAGSTDPDLVRGGLLGLAAALVAVAVPPLVAVAVLVQLQLGWGPVLVLLAAVALVGLAFPGGKSPERAAAEPRLPALTKLLTAAGALAVLSGALAIAGALTPHLQMPSYLDDPSPYPARLLLPGGVVLVLLGAGLLIRRKPTAPRSAIPTGSQDTANAQRAAAALRPALTVAWAMLPLGGAAALDAVLMATQLASAEARAGAWLSGAAMLLAMAAAVVAAVAGAVERDDVDLTEQDWRPSVAVPAAIAAVLSLGAVFLPVLTAPDYTPPGIFTEFSTSSWGLIATGAAALAALVLAPRCRPPRAVALLGGAALVMSVRVLEFPITSGRFEGAAPGLGLWFAIAAVLAIAVTAGFAARR